MSHELRTPLNAIIGFSDAIRVAMAGPLSERYREYATFIHNSGRQLLGLVDDLLDISKLEAGRYPLQEQAVDMYAVLRMAIQCWETRAAEAKLHVTAAIAADMPLLYGDGESLQRIFSNLLSNAIRFTPEGGTIHVSGQHASDGGLLIAIQDTGIGMAADQIPVALEAFRQINSRFRRNLAGAGLGLPIARHLVELHGGTLCIDSRIDIGTAVTIYFPATRLIGKPTLPGVTECGPFPQPASFPSAASHPTPEPSVSVP